MVTEYSQEVLSRYSSLIARLLPGAKLIDLRQLVGGLSANVVLDDVDHAGTGGARYVVRRYGTVDTARNPNIARDEFSLLALVRERGVPAPRPMAFDDTGETFPEPVIIVSYLEGSPLFPGDLESYLDQTAKVLALIHAIDPANDDLAYLLPVRDPLSDIHAHLTSAAIEPRLRVAIQHALEARTVHLPVNRPALLHGDVFSGNLIWEFGRLVGVIDWEDAATGDPLYDLAKCRLEFSCEHGVEAAERLASLYAAANPLVDLSGLVWWDLALAMRLDTKIETWSIPADQFQRLRRGIRAFADHVAQSQFSE